MAKKSSQLLLGLSLRRIVLGGTATRHGVEGKDGTLRKQDPCSAEQDQNDERKEKKEKLYGILSVYLEIGAGKPCAAHASARDSPSTPRYLLRPSPVPFGAVRPDGSGRIYVHCPDMYGYGESLQRVAQRDILTPGSQYHLPFEFLARGTRGYLVRALCNAIVTERVLRKRERNTLSLGREIPEWCSPEPPPTSLERPRA
ncbi:hypothetical protein K0M31_004753 [Melipona bicolor]|uniref:Uncharacterized protein n=1 Tax=Melipona bicolor TaxID=60889 RepID=A0AA40KMN0_9HYME|nr:hypothetical protein K0M31_004753 [Melipona bicolor]